MAWDVPAVTQYKRGQCAVRYERYRYIRYSDGSEELYDHEKDPKEWTNLAGNRAYLAIKKELSKSVPHKWAKGAPSKSAYKFDHREYTWIHRQSRKTAK
jgi:hypothetical protein